MTRPDTLEETVLGCLAQSCYLAREDLRADLRLVDLGLDSLAITSVVAELEAVYSLDLSPDAIVSLLQADDLGTFIEQIRALIPAPSTSAAEAARA